MTQDFCRTISEDPELRKLRRTDVDPAENLATLLAVFGCHVGIGGLPVEPLTVARWAFLWAIGNRFATGGKPGESDLDVVLFVVSRDVRDLCCTVEELPARASGYAAATGLPADDVAREIASLIDAAFRPLALLPKSGSADENVCFDADWAVTTAAIAAREGNTTVDAALYEMPLAEVCLLFLSYFRRESLDGKKAHRQISDEAMRKIFQRIEDLRKNFQEK